MVASPASRCLQAHVGRTSEDAVLFAFLTLPLVTVPLVALLAMLMPIFVFAIQSQHPA